MAFYEFTVTKTMSYFKCFAMAAVCINVRFMFPLKFIESSYFHFHFLLGYMFKFSLQINTNCVFLLLDEWMDIWLICVTLCPLCSSQITDFTGIQQKHSSSHHSSTQLKMKKINFLKYCSPNFRFISLFNFFGFVHSVGIQAAGALLRLLELRCKQLPVEENKTTRVKLNHN